MNIPRSYGIAVLGCAVFCGLFNFLGESGWVGDSWVMTASRLLPPLPGPVSLPGAAALMVHSGGSEAFIEKGS